MISSRNLRSPTPPSRRRCCWRCSTTRRAPPREIVTLNAGTALYTANVVESIGAGIALARECIASGAARAKLDEFVAFTRQFA
jgi:anthranilate phosphoribosyltransferase